MSSFFYNLGRKAGRSLMKGKFVYQSIFGTETEAIHAEYMIGGELANKLKQQIPVLKDQALHVMVQEIGTNLARTLKNNQRKFHFEVLDSVEVNALALPGGFIFTTVAILHLCHFNKDEIAFILSHELGHVIFSHPMQRIVANSSVNILASIIKTGGILGQVAKKMVTDFLKSNYSRDNELAADQFAIKTMARAGYQATAAITLLKRLDAGSSRLDYFSSHPAINDRIAKINDYFKGPE